MFSSQASCDRFDDSELFNVLCPIGERRTIGTFGQKLITFWSGFDTSGQDLISKIGYLRLADENNNI